VALTVDAFEAAYRSVGYERCGSSGFELRFEKIAVFAKPNGEPTHAARQLDSGRWTSKLGRHVDIEHGEPNVLTSAVYGAPVMFMRRRRSLPSLALAWIRRRLGERH
jgi:hypothetical protein